jgi:hypothetical protein
MVESGIAGVLSTVWLTYVQALVWLSQRTLTANLALSATAALIILGTIVYVLVNGVVLKRFEDKIGPEVMKPAGVLITIGFILILLVTGSIAWIIPWLWILALAFVAVLIYWGYALIKTGAAAGYQISAEAKERWESARSTWASAAETEATAKKTMAEANAEAEVYDRVSRTTTKIGKFRDWFRRNATMLKKDLLTLRNALAVAATRPDINFMQLIGVIENRLNQIRREKAYETTEEKKAGTMEQLWTHVDTQIKTAEAEQKNFFKKLEKQEYEIIAQSKEMAKVYASVKASNLPANKKQFYEGELKRIGKEMITFRDDIVNKRKLMQHDYKKEVVDVKDVGTYIKEFEALRQKFLGVVNQFAPIVGYVEAAKAAITAGNHAQATKPVDDAIAQVDKIIKLQKVQDGTFKQMNAVLGKIKKPIGEIAGAIALMLPLLEKIEVDMKKYAADISKVKTDVDQEIAASKKVTAAPTQVPPAQHDFSKTAYAQLLLDKARLTKLMRTEPTKEGRATYRTEMVAILNEINKRKSEGRAR